MSYRGPVSHQQRWPTTTQLGQDYYGSGQNFRNEVHLEQNRGMDGYNQSRDTGYYNSPQYGGYREPSPDRNPQVVYRTNEPAALPSHQYSETFQRNDPSRGESWERHSNPAPNPPHQSWENDPQRGNRGYQSQQYNTQGDYGYEDHGWTRSDMDQGSHGPSYDRHEQYNKSRDTGLQDRDARIDHLTPPSWQDPSQDGHYPQANSYNRQAPPPTRSQNDYRDHSIRGNNRQNSEWNNPSQKHHNFHPNSFAQSRGGSDNHIQHDQPRDRQYHDNYRADDYDYSSQADVAPNLSERPQVLAKTSGSSAVFGIVARVDTSPTRRNPPALVPMKIEPEPQTSPTRDYVPPFDRYQENETPRDPPTQSSQQHQYHHALTPISEKPSPPSSISSRDHPQDPTWSMKGQTNPRDQYALANSSGQPWHPQPDRRHPETARSGYVYHPQPQHQDRPPPQAPRPGHREYEYQESSGYGSESTHYTERSYIEPQRFSDKGQRSDNRFPSDPPRTDDWARSPTGSYDHSPTRGRSDGLRDRYQTEDVRSSSRRFEQRNNSQPQTSYDERLQDNNDRLSPSRLPLQRLDEHNTAGPHDSNGQRSQDSYGAHQPSQSGFLSSQTAPAYGQRDVAQPHASYDQRRHESSSLQNLDGHNRRNGPQPHVSYGQGLQDNYDARPQTQIDSRSSLELSEVQDQRKRLESNDVRSSSQDSERYNQRLHISHSQRPQDNFDVRSRSSQADSHSPSEAFQARDQRPLSRPHVSCEQRSHGSSDARPQSQGSRSYEQQNVAQVNAYHGYDVHAQSHVNLRSSSQGLQAREEDNPARPHSLRLQESDNVRSSSQVLYNQQNGSRSRFTIHSPSQADLRSPSQVSRPYDERNAAQRHVTFDQKHPETIDSHSQSQVGSRPSQILHGYNQQNVSRPPASYEKEPQGDYRLRSRSQDLDGHEQRNVAESHDSYGPPVTIPAQFRTDHCQPLTDNRHGSQDRGRDLCNENRDFHSDVKPAQRKPSFGVEETRRPHDHGRDPRNDSRDFHSGVNSAHRKPSSGVEETRRPQDLRRDLRQENDDFGSDTKPLRRKPSSGVEVTHVQSVRAARSMFEKKSDPRRPLLAPKPIPGHKPSVTHAQAAPPRLPAPSNRNWGQQNDTGRFHPWSSQGPKSPLSPQHDSRPVDDQRRVHPSHSRSMDNLDERKPNRNWSTRDNADQFRLRSPQDPKSPRSPQHDSRSGYYQQTMQTTHSQSLDNLDERSDDQVPSSQKHHSQSMLNLDDRSKYQPKESHWQPDQDRGPIQSTGSRDGYSSYSESAVAEDRPIVVAVKYSEDSGPSVYQEPSRLGSRGMPPTESKMPQQGSRERSRSENEMQRPEYRPQMSPTEPRKDRSSWSLEPNRDNRQQSYNSRSAVLNSKANFTPVKEQNTDKTTHGHIQDGVGRNYEMSRQLQTSAPRPQHTAQDRYDGYRHQETVQDTGFDSRPQSIEQTSENRNSIERWPTPPPPITQEPSPTRDQPPENSQSYNDNWRRPGPPRTHLSPGPIDGQSEYRLRTQPHLNAPGTQPRLDAPSSHFPLPPQQTDTYDSESSEVDVDAPTPPPSNKPIRIQNIMERTRVESAYDRNKPAPTGSSSYLDSRRRFQSQPRNVGEQPFTVNQNTAYSKVQPPTFQAKPLSKSGQPSVKSPPPQKPQRNSTILSPQFTQAAISNDKTVRPLGNAPVQPFSGQSPREKNHPTENERMMNRRPQREQEIQDEDDFQIEVTDSDLSATAASTSIEVHRMESVRAFKAKREKDKDASYSAVNRLTKQRASQRTGPPANEEKLDSRKVVGKKTNTKLVYKMPSSAVTSNVMSHSSGPVPWSNKRPLGYRDLPNKFKHVRDPNPAEKQDKMVKLEPSTTKQYDKKEPKSSPQSKYMPLDRNAKTSDKTNTKIPPRDDRGRSRRRDEERTDVVRSSTRSSSTVKPEKYDGDDDATNGSKHGKEGRRSEKDRQRDKDRAMSRGRNFSPGDRDQPRHSRSMAPEDRPRKNENNKKSEERRRRNDDSSFPHHRSRSPDRRRHHDDDRDRHHQRSPPHRQQNQPHRSGGHGPNKEPDWVEQFRRGRESRDHKSRAKDPRRIEVTVDGRRRELDMDAFEREVNKATSYNSDFEQPEMRKQMIPSKLSSRPPSGSKQQTPPGDWMNALKERNRNAARTRLGNLSRY